jgi:hypothetical protein
MKGVSDRMELFLAILIGVGLSISAGFRVFTPLLIASVAGKLGWLPLASSFEWISSTPALIAFIVAFILEVGSNYIPIVDNALKAISAPLALVAGTLLSISVIGIDESPFLAWGMAFVTGGGAATITQLTSTAVRSTSTVTTGGLGNPVVAFFEDVISVLISILSIALPVLVLVIVGIILFIFFKLMSKIRNRKTRVT